jgi:hypothetical protein
MEQARPQHRDAGEVLRIVGVVSSLLMSALVIAGLVVIAAIIPIMVMRFMYALFF